MVLTNEVLRERLALIFEWYKGMVNRQTGRVVYLYDPVTETLVADGSPIRDIASIWDMEILGDYLNRQELQPAVERSLDHYIHYLTKRDGYTILDPRLLGEPSSIAHSAFMLLSLIHSRLSDRKEKAQPLADGILVQQRTDGSYKIYFGSERDDGLEFYPGEAMLALLETYRLTKEKRYLESVEQGFLYYKTKYYERNRVQPGLLPYFANWQSQFCRLLYEDTQKEELRGRVRDYVFQLHDKMIERGFYERIGRYPEKQISVEVACALEGLNDAFAIALQENHDHKGTYRDSVCTALAYLLKLQCVRHCAEKERGCFGFSFSDHTQRIDVTGHFVNGMIKSLRNEIRCGEVEEKGEKALR
ncbi:MAG: hypothetical protein EHM36_09860 [Deltaproteobacteria bacterium]|nr:MAG: hypothetical protein EHM36_09860 [Deltaproteobacteria bacterium]